ncbi:MAG: hypothetical protein CR982_02535, partial [Candidatus Cloacimonadota bacterium]
ITVNDNQGKAVASDTAEIIVNPINDAPTIELPESFTFDEDGNLEVNFEQYISDIDEDVLTLSVSESENDTISVSFEGLVATLTAPENWNGSETIIITVNDGVSKATASDTVNVIVNPVNDPPVIELPDITIEFKEGQNDTLLIPQGSTITVTDVDDEEIDSAKVEISVNYIKGKDILTLDDTTSEDITASFDSENGVLILGGKATIEEYEDILKSIKYKNTDQDPNGVSQDNPLKRTITWKVNDGSDYSNEDTTYVNVTATDKNKTKKTGDK